MKDVILNRAATGFVLIIGLVVALPTALAEEKKASTPLRAGIIGLDTSHVQAFTAIMNGPESSKLPVPIRVVAAFPGGSKDIDVSYKRVDGFTRLLRDKYQVEIVSSIDELLKKVDVVLLESVDGRPHLEQARPVLKARKPLFIDKPVAASLVDVLQIYDLAKQTGTPCFSSSATRFARGTQEAHTNADVGEVQTVMSTGPCSLEPHHPDLFWYGVHGVDALYTIMGTGCQSVVRSHTENLDEVKGTWKDGRIGVFKGTRGGKYEFNVKVIGSKGSKMFSTYDGYVPLVMEIAKFFKTGKPPVSAEETIELIAYMEAADESKFRGGAPVKLADVMARARSQIANKGAAK